MSSPVDAQSDFADASQAVVTYLKEHLPLGTWGVSRYDGESQIFLTVDDDNYGLAPGSSHPWRDSLCQHMVSGAGPKIAPDAQAVPVYRDAAAMKANGYGAYVGIPIHDSGGELFGALCGIDPQRQNSSLGLHEPLLDLLAELLEKVLRADQDRTETARAIERANLSAETDVLTGLLNRRGWDRYLAIEDERYRRFGDPCSVIAVDLDGLKQINDTQGHEAGDLHLQNAAKALREDCRATDLVARLGGDEFGIIVAQTTRHDAAALLQRIEATFAKAGIEASFGVAPYCVAEGLQGAWRASDLAMYAEKARRRDARAAGGGTKRDTSAA